MSFTRELEGLKTIARFGGRVACLEGENGLRILQMLPAEEGGIFVFDDESVPALEHAVSALEKEPSLQGVVVVGTEKGFIAGADVHSIASITDKEEATELSKRGQALFARLSGLPCTTVAAIHGPCLGGGFELALSLDYRIATRDGSTKVGLPEVMLGILPGFGGTQRLPRLIGLPQALELMLKGTRLDSRRAKRRGLVDRVVPIENLMRRASELALSGKKPSRRLRRKDRFLTHTGVGRGIVAFSVGKTLSRGPARFMSAPSRILSASLAGLRQPDGDYETEARFLGELAVGSTCKNLIRLFLATEAARKLHRELDPDCEPIRSAVVVGGGTMGAGIAGLLARKSVKTRLVDLSEQALSRAVARHAGAVGKARARGRMRPEDAQRALDSLSVSRTLNGAAGKDLILEAVLEDLELKERIFADAAEHLAEDAIFATNTSSLSLQDLQRDMKHPELLVGLHFFNPPERMPLVEVVHREGTSKKGLARVARLASDLGKFPVLVRDCPGFLVNRCLAPYLAQGVAMLEEGIDPERIDRIAEDFGLPMGPLRLIDEIGWDIAAKVCDVLSEAYPDRMSASELFQVVAGEGLLGRKSGQGVYSYGKKGKTSLNKRFKTLVKTGGHLRPGSGMDDREVLDRLLLPLVAEAFRCLEDGIVASEEEIDLAMIMGTGFPPHLGGPLRWARDRGLEAIRESIEKLSGKTGLRVADSRTLTGKAGSTPARASEAVTADPASAAVENEEPDPENEKKDALEVSPVAGKEPEETTG